MRQLALLPASLVLLYAQVAQAYILPADFLLRLYAEKRLAAKISDVSVQLTTDLPEENVTVEERLYLKRPERRRLVRQGEEETVAYVYREGRRAQGPEDALETVANTRPHLLTDLLVPKGSGEDETGAHLLGRVRDAGIDTSVVSLGQHNGAIFYVIGAKSWETNKAQLWLDKGTFLPVRIVTYDANKVRQETRLLEWGSSVGGDWFPQIVEEYRDGKLVRRAEASKVAINEKLPETLFALPR